MNILQKLTELANDFDKKGLYDEAAILDQIVKEAQGGFQRSLAPGITGDPDPTRMAPGQGAGGLPYVPMKEQVWEPEIPDILGPGVAGKTKPRSRNFQPRVYRFQNEYNILLKQLGKLGLNISAYGSPLVEDGLWGPKTRAARKLMPRLKQIMQNELRSKTEIPGIPAPKPGQLFPPAGVPSRPQMGR